MTKMNPYVKAMWLEALRDGTRKQGTGQLRDRQGNQCCLDVLCELGVDKQVIEAPELSLADGLYQYSYTDEIGYPTSEETVLPDPVREWAGLDCNDPFVLDLKQNKTAQPLSHFNDDLMYTFEQIADLIEEQL